MERKKQDALFFPRIWLYARTGSGHRAVAEQQLVERTADAEQKEQLLAEIDSELAQKRAEVAQSGHSARRDFRGGR